MVAVHMFSPRKTADSVIRLGNSETKLKNSMVFQGNGEFGALAKKRANDYFAVVVWKNTMGFNNENMYSNPHKVGKILY